MIEKILGEAGLTKGEIKVYLALLELKQSTSGPIAKKSKISYSKVYLILDKLEQKGLVSQIEINGVMHFQAEDPSRVNEYLKEKREKLKMLQQKFDNILPELRHIMEKSDKRQSVRLYFGLSGMATSHEHVYSRLKSGEEFVTFGITTKRDSAIDRYWIKDHKRRIRAGIRVKLAFNQSTPSSILEHRNNLWGCDARYMPIPFEIPAWITVYKGVTLIVLPAEPLSEIISIEILNEGISKAFRTYFDSFWMLTKPFKAEIKGAT